MKTDDLTGYEEFTEQVNLGQLIRDLYQAEDSIDEILKSLSKEYGIIIKGWNLHPIWQMDSRAPVAYMPKLEFEI